MAALQPGVTVDTTARAYSRGGYSGQVYNFRLSLTLNSQNIQNNTSNITIKLGLAYDGTTKKERWNYNANYGPWDSLMYSFDNTNWVTVKNRTVQNIYVPTGGGINSFKDMDSWTGDIAHNTDGTRTISVRMHWYPRTNQASTYNWDPRETELTISNIELNPNPRVQVSNGSSWVAGTPYVSDGSSWVAGVIKVSNGTNWLP